MQEDLYESNRNNGELYTKTYMKAIETMVNYARRPIWKQSKLWWIIHEDLYESNRNDGELCKKTYMKAIKTMVNYARRPIWKQSKLW